MNENLSRVSEAFNTSSSPLSRQLCKELDSMGTMGQLASLLFKAEKASKQANSYSGQAPISRRPYCDYSHDRMRKMLMEVVRLLDTYAMAIDIAWGWSMNDESGKPPWKLCIELPTGLVTFRMRDRRLGPDYGLGAEDECHNPEHITAFCAGVLDGYWMVKEEEIWEQPAPRNPQIGD